MELKCGAQNYEWGKLGSNSLVAQLLKSANQNTPIEDEKPYAELWMGCHVSMPSNLVKENISLQEFINKNPSVLGQKVIGRFGNELPFLFKVLSIEKALSIQAHPSKKLAAELHAKTPDIYKDPNYKPEMAIALTPFEALCGFRSACSIRGYLQAIPELNKLVSNTNIKDDYELIKTAFHCVLQQPKEKINEEVNNLLQRVSSMKNEQQRLFESADLIERLGKQFPGDVGIFMVYFLNYVQLKEGEAIFLAECEPHAYISGDCVECMACSDNVVRAGLTPKLIDVDTLVSMLTYETSTANAKIFRPVEEDRFTLLFKPPVPDFAVAKIKIPLHAVQYSLIERESANILIVTSGSGLTKEKGQRLRKGTVLFVPANEKITILVADHMEIYQAFVNT